MLFLPSPLPTIPPPRPPQPSAPPRSPHPNYFSPQTPTALPPPTPHIPILYAIPPPRPPQPSAPHPPIPGVPAAPKELTQQCKEKLSTADVASNMIISNPGLTGKHIAAMTNSSQPPPSSVLPNSAYSSPISSAELLPGSTLLNVPLSQHMDTGWGFPPQPPNFQNALQPPVPMATTGGVSQDASSQQPNVEGLKSRLESGVPPGPPQSPQGSRSGGGQPPSGGEPGQLNSSPRPRILRGKRPLDG